MGGAATLCRPVLTSGTVSDPVVIAQVSVSQIMGAGSNPAMHIVNTCCGVVNLHLFHPKLLCDPPPTPPALRVSGRWGGGSESGWVGLRVGGWV